LTRVVFIKKSLKILLNYCLNECLIIKFTCESFKLPIKHEIFVSKTVVNFLLRNLISLSNRRMRTPARPVLPPKTPKSRQASKENLVKDPVHVFCRIRPMQSEADLSCIQAEINARLTRLRMSPRCAGLTKTTASLFSLLTLKSTTIVCTIFFAAASSFSFH
jgi:hypothetical protein